jgi:hypothetical protein
MLEVIVLQIFNPREVHKIMEVQGLLKEDLGKEDQNTNLKEILILEKVEEDIFEEEKEVDVYDHEEMAHHLSQILPFFS